MLKVTEKVYLSLHQAELFERDEGSVLASAGSAALSYTLMQLTGTQQKWHLIGPEEPLIVSLKLGRLGWLGWPGLTPSLYQLPRLAFPEERAQ